jgi:hypothetical protein
MNKFIKTFLAIKTDNPMDLATGAKETIKSILFIIFFAICMIIGLWGIAEFIVSIF